MSMIHERHRRTDRRKTDNLRQQYRASAVHRAVKMKCMNGKKKNKELQITTTASASTASTTTIKKLPL